MVSGIKLYFIYQLDVTFIDPSIIIIIIFARIIIKFTKVQEIKKIHSLIF